MTRDQAESRCRNGRKGKMQPFCDLPRAPLAREQERIASFYSWGGEPRLFPEFSSSPAVSSLSSPLGTPQSSAEILCLSAASLIPSLPPSLLFFLPFFSFFPSCDRISHSPGQSQFYYVAGMTLNFCSSCFYLPGSEIADRYHCI